MKQRVVIEKLNDGHIVVDKQQLSNAIISGNAHQRKLAKAALQNGEVIQKWQKTERTIFRNGTVEATFLIGAASIGTYIVPFGSDPEIKAQAAANQQQATNLAFLAEVTAAGIAEQNEAFTVRKPKNVVVTITEVD